MFRVWLPACGYKGVDEGGVAGAEEEGCGALLQQQLLHSVHGHRLTALAAGVSIGTVTADGGSCLLLHEILQQADAVLQLPPHVAGIIAGIIACGEQHRPPAMTR